MAPIVEYGSPTPEQSAGGMKHHRKCHWKEFRLCTVSLPGASFTYYGVVRGSPMEAGRMMKECCQKQGMDNTTHIHGGAWIAEQYEEPFGVHHKFHIDYYPVSQYLASASRQLDKAELFRQKRGTMVV